MYTLRPALPGDAPALQTLYALCVDRAGWLPPEARLNPRFDLVSENELVHVAVASSGALLGLVSVYVSSAFVHHLYVHPAHHGQGLGRNLLASLRPVMRPPWQLKCLNTNHAALAFYKRQGWLPLSSGSGEHGPYVLLQWGVSHAVP